MCTISAHIALSCMIALEWEVSLDNVGIIPSITIDYKRRGKRKGERKGERGEEREKEERERERERIRRVWRGRVIRIIIIVTNMSSTSLLGQKECTRLQQRLLDTLMHSSSVDDSICKYDYYNNTSTLTIIDHVD